MCGVLAHFGAEQLDDRTWTSALETLSCRGPDGMQQVVRDQARIGHTRLAVIGVGDAGLQPVVNDRYALSFNGEIYNYREIARELGIPGESDTHVLFHALQDDIFYWIHRLRGMFACVLYDSKENSVFTLRDAYGIKPLYSRHFSNGGIAFGSTAQSVASINRRPDSDQVALASMLATGIFHKNRSAYEHVSKLAPGYLTEWKHSGYRWSVRNQVRLDESIWPAFPLEQALDNSIDAHLVADVEVGIFLSGGVDSTLIAALASERRKGLRTFSIVNPRSPALDEGTVARLNSGRLGTCHTEVSVTPDKLSEEAAQLIQSTGEPFGDAAFLPLSLLSRRAAESVKVVLAGEGADELFGGYKRYEVERRLDRDIARSMLLPLSLLTARVPALAGSRRPWRRALAAASHGSPADRHAVLLMASWEAVTKALGDVARQAMEEFQKEWTDTAENPWNLGLLPQRAYDLSVLLPNVYLEKSDRASMLHGLEVRTPYIDPIVARASRDFSPRDSSKRPLREILRTRFPELTVYKRKRGLSVDVRALNQGPLKDYIHGPKNAMSSIFDGLDSGGCSQLTAACLSDQGLAFRLGIMSLWYELSRQN